MSQTIPEPHYGQPMTGEFPTNVQQYVNPVGEVPAPQVQVQQAPVQSAPEMIQTVPVAPVVPQLPVTDVQVQITTPVEPQVNPQPMVQNVNSVPAPAPIEAPAVTTNVNSQVDNGAPMAAPVQQVPAQQTPVQQVPAQQTPIQQAPVQQVPAQQTPVQQVPAQQVPAQQYGVPQQASVQQAPVPGSSAPGYSNQPYMDINAIRVQTPTGHPLKTKFTGEAILVAGKTIINKKGNKMASGIINPTPGVPNTPTYRFICFSTTASKQIDVVESPQYTQYIQVKKVSGARIQFTGSWEENTYNGNTSLQLMMDDFTFMADPNIKGYAENYIDPVPANPMDMLNGGNVGGMPGQMPGQIPGQMQGMPGQVPGQMPGYNPQGQYQAPQGQPYGAPQGQMSGQIPGQMQGIPGQVPGYNPQYNQNQIPGIPPLPNIPGIQQ